MKKGMNGTQSTTLTRLAQSMESLRPAGAQPAWAEIIGPPDHPDRVVWHPDLETMIGAVAPPDCEALAAVGYGWARGLAEGPPGAREILKPGERRRVRVVCLMTRGGDLAGYVRDNATVLISEPPTIGRVPDCMRRCFGLPTPPPDEPSDVLLAGIWLNNVLGVVEGTGQPLTWPKVARLHPVIEVAEAGGVAVPSDQLRRIMQVGAEIWNWRYLAEQAAAPGWLNDLLPPGAGGWMDEGILSRWLFESLASSRVDHLLDQITPLLDADAADKVRLTLKQLGVLERSSGRPRPSRV
jgi:hypothetical protein